MDGTVHTSSYDGFIQWCWIPTQALQHRESIPLQQVAVIFIVVVIEAILPPLDHHSLLCRRSLRLLSGPRQDRYQLLVGYLRYTHVDYEAPAPNTPRNK